MGRVAQLGERIVRNDEVAGSTPVSSTIVFHLRAVIFLNSKFCVVTVSWRPFSMFFEALRFAATAWL
jgi:hypothetical protein